MSIFFLIFLSIFSGLSWSAIGRDDVAFTLHVRARVTRSYQGGSPTVISATETLRQQWRISQVLSSTSFEKQLMFASDYARVGVLVVSFDRLFYAAIDPLNLARLLGIVRGDQTTTTKTAILIPLRFLQGPVDVRGVEADLTLEEEKIHVILDFLADKAFLSPKKDAPKQMPSRSKNLTSAS